MWNLFRHPVWVLLKTAAPLSVVFGFQTLMNLVETLVVARVSETSLADFAFASSLYNIFFLLIVGLSSSAVASVSKAIGIGDREKVLATVQTSYTLVFYLSACATVFLTGFAFFYRELFDCLSCNNGMNIWLTTALPGFPALCIFVWLRSICTAYQSVSYLTRAMLISTIANVLLMVWFSFDATGTLGLGLAGVGLAGSVTKWILLATTLHGTRKNPELAATLHFTPYPLRRLPETIPELIDGCIVGTRIFLAEWFPHVSLIAATALMDQVSVGVHIITLRLIALFTTVAMSLSSASASLIARLLGQKNDNCVRAIRSASMRLALVLSAIGSFFVATIAPDILLDNVSGTKVIPLQALMLFSGYLTLSCVQTVTIGCLLGFGDRTSALYATFWAAWVAGAGVFLLVATLFVRPISLNVYWAAMSFIQTLSLAWCLLALYRKPIPPSSLLLLSNQGVIK